MNTKKSRTNFKISNQKQIKSPFGVYTQLNFSQKLMRVKLLTAMHNNKIIAFEFFCVIQNKQDLGECYQPSASTKITPTSILFIPNITEKLRQAIWQSWIVNYLRPSRAAHPFKLPCSLAPESGRFKENSFQPFIYWQTNLFFGCWGCTFKLPYCPVFKWFLCELNDDQPNREIKTAERGSDKHMKRFMLPRKWLKIRTILTISGKEVLKAFVESLSTSLYLSCTLKLRKAEVIKEMV